MVGKYKKDMGVDFLFEKQLEGLNEKCGRTDRGDNKQ